MKLYTVYCTFPSSHKQYTFQSTLHVKQGEEVIVLPRPGYAVARVIKVEERSTSDPTLAWVVSRISIESHERNMRKLRKL